jgi:hypothetical protein
MSATSAPDVHKVNILSVLNAMDFGDAAPVKSALADSIATSIQHQKSHFSEAKGVKGKAAWFASGILKKVYSTTDVTMTHGTLNRLMQQPSNKALFRLFTSRLAPRHQASTSLHQTLSDLKEYEDFTVIPRYVHDAQNEHRELLNACAPYTTEGCDPLKLIVSAKEFNATEALEIKGRLDAFFTPEPSHYTSTKNKLLLAMTCSKTIRDYTTTILDLIATKQEYFFDKNKDLTDLFLPIFGHLFPVISKLGAADMADSDTIFDLGDAIHPMNSQNLSDCFFWHIFNGPLDLSTLDKDKPIDSLIFSNGPIDRYCLNIKKLHEDKDGGDLTDEGLHDGFVQQVFGVGYSGVKCEKSYPEGSDRIPHTATFTLSWQKKGEGDMPRFINEPLSLDYSSMHLDEEHLLEAWRLTNIFVNTSLEAINETLQEYGGPLKPEQVIAIARQCLFLREVNKEWKISASRYPVTKEAPEVSDETKALICEHIEAFILEVYHHEGAGGTGEEKSYDGDWVIVASSGE